MRVCPKCGEQKIDLAFGVNRRERDGLNRVCRKCHANAQVKYQNEKKMKAILKYRPEWSDE